MGGSTEKGDIIITTNDDDDDDEEEAIDVAAPAILTSESMKRDGLLGWTA